MIKRSWDSEDKDVELVECKKGRHDLSKSLVEAETDAEVEAYLTMRNFSFDGILSFDKKMSRVVEELVETQDFYQACL